MTVFKYYLKVTKSYLPIIIIYTLIFVGIAMLTSTSGSTNGQTYVAEEAKIAFINHDVDSEFMDSFQNYIQENAKYVELEDTEDSLRDALFFRKVDYIMIVPQHFTEDFLNDKDVKIKTMEVPDSYGAVYSKQLMNKYLNIAKLYLKADISDQEMTQLVQKNLTIHTDVVIEHKAVDSQISSVKNFYNFSNYTLLAIIIAVIAMVMISFNEDKIKNRQLISCLPYQKLNRQLLLGNILITFGVWLLYVVASIALYGKTMLTPQGLLMILNSFVFVIFVLILSFLIVTLTHQRELVSGISTVIGLGTSFIAGAFVPQEFLAPFVLNLAKLTPSYWFITNNNTIAKLTDFSIIDLQPILMNMGVILGFTIIFYLLIQLISRLRIKKI